MTKIIQVPVEEEIQNSYIDYAMSVIVGRAIPDARDGLKPVQRRILYGMYNLNNFHNQPTKKSARIVGDIMGHLHPHGDMAIYDALVRMAQDFSLNHLFVEGQGNFGSIDGDPPAAMRYTEVRLTKLAEEMLSDLDKETVELIPNFDNTEKEPLVLPSKVPNLLVNGASGIAVGVATSMPPHNLSEVCEAVMYLLDHKEAIIDEITSIVKGPDFPTGGIAIMSGSAYNGYKFGRGQIIIRAKALIDEKNNRIVINEIPYGVNKSAIIEKAAELVKEKKLIGIRDIRDESDRTGLSIIIETKDIDPQRVLNGLYNHTQLQVTFPIINLAVVGKELRSFNVLQLLNTFIAHRRDVITKRSKYELNVANDRLHIVEGLLVAISNIDKIITTIKESGEIAEARSRLSEQFNLSEKQVNAILEMRLGRLTKLDDMTLGKEKLELGKKITYYSDLLADANKIDEIIKKETLEIKEKYSRPRRTQLLFIDQPFEVKDEDMISDEPVTVLLTNSGYVKRLNMAGYKEQERGGKGIIAMNLKEDDFVKEVITARNKDYIICVTDKGRIYWLKAYNIPEGTRYSEGRSIVNLLSLSNEKIADLFKIKDFVDTKIAFLTKKGLVKKLHASLFSRPRSTGVRAITLNSDDSIADAIVYTKEPYFVIATKNGKSIKFEEGDVRFTGRTSAGVRGIRLRGSDTAETIIAANEEGSLLTISEKGYGKVTDIKKYRMQGRGGTGIINLKVNDKTGLVTKSLFASKETKLLLVNSKGISITMPLASIRITGRAASGVRLMKLEQGAKVIDARLMAGGEGAEQSISTT